MIDMSVRFRRGLAAAAVTLLAGLSGVHAQDPGAVAPPADAGVPATMDDLKSQFDTGELDAAARTAGQLLTADPANARAAQYKQLIDTRLQARAALAREAQVTDSEIRANTIAVVNFVNTGENKDLDPLQKGLAEMLVTDLAQVERLTVVERSQMQALMTEMSLEMTGLLQEGTGARMGKLLGAAKVVTGSFQSGADNTIVMNAGIADVTGGGSSAVQARKGKLEDLFKLEKDLVFDVVKSMGIVLSDEERKQIEVVPTENVLAYLAYAKALDAEDRGDFTAAAAHMAEAHELDPNLGAEPAAAEGEQEADPTAQTEETGSTEMGGDALNTAVFTVGGVPVSATAPTSVTALNAVNSAFMPEALLQPKTPTVTGESKDAAAATTEDAVASPVAESTERNSFIDSQGLEYDGGTKSVDVRLPIPDDGM